jgi:cytochrome c553
MRQLALAALVCLRLHAAEGNVEFFETKVRPVLAERCFSCHTQTKLGGLEMVSQASLAKVVVPGKPAESLLLSRVRSGEMPPAGGKLKDSEIANLEAWIRDGAVWPASPVPTAKSKDYVIRPEQRAYWAFQPVQKPAGNIDSLLQAAWKAKGLTPAPPASKATLLRRASLDLTGLPPTYEETAAFLHDKSPRAWANVIDRLLASPRYGERWGRHWLDVARYSDDKLNSTMDEPQPNAFRFRDWVIEAFNNDLPYNTFVKAQIAADHLNDPSLLPALGLYGLNPEFQDDRVDVTTRGFLGLTVACAQCHDHKFDPIPTKDYYSLLGIFNSSRYKEHPLADPATVKTYETADKTLQRAKADRDEFIKKQSEQVMDLLAAKADLYLLAATGKGKHDGLDGETVDRLKTYLARKDREAPQVQTENPAAFRQVLVNVLREKRAIDEKNLIRLGGSTVRSDLAAADLLSLSKDDFYLYREFFGARGVFFYGDGKIDRWLQGPYREHLEFLRQTVTLAEQARPARYPFLHTIADIEKPRNEKVHLRGNRATLGDEAPRGWLAILSKPNQPELFTKGSGRLELAERIASPGNPLTARVMANRIWQGHFGEGIVRTASNFGILGERPSHPELLDHLAARLVETNWSIKSLHREIMLSAAYRLAATPVPASEKIDPENRLYWRFPRRRLDAEAIRDSVLFVSGQLDLTPGGKATPLDDPKNHRRTVYGYVSRRRTDTMLNLFDFPNPNNTSERRIETNVPLQRLFLLNSPLMLQAAAALTADLKTPDPAAAYRRLFARLPNPAELQIAKDYLAKNGQWSEYLQALLSSNEFLYLE